MLLSGEPSCPHKKRRSIFPAEQGEMGTRAMVPRTRTARARGPGSRQWPCKSHSECAQRATSPATTPAEVTTAPALIPPRPPLQAQTSPPSLPGKRARGFPCSQGPLHTSPTATPGCTVACPPPTQACACAVGPQVSEDRLLLPLRERLLSGRQDGVWSIQSVLSLPAPPAPCYTVGFSVVKYSISLCLFIFH